MSSAGFPVGSDSGSVGRLLWGYHVMPPDGWEDQSVQNFVLNDGYNVASLTVTRAQAPAHLSPAEFSTAEFERLAGSLPHFEPIDKRPMAVANGTTELLECRWRTPKGTVHQLVAGLPGDGCMIVFTGSSPDPMPAAVRNRILGVIAGATPIAIEPGR